MSSMYDGKRRKIFQDCVNSLQEAVLLVGEYFVDDERDLNLEDLNNLAKQYHQDETRYNLSKTALNLTADYYNNDENDRTITVDEIYEKNLTDSVTSIVPFEQHPDMQKILTSIKNVINKSNIEDDIAENDVTVDDSNKSIVVTQVTQLPLDPITKMEIQNPWKNKVCGHIYEYVSIMKYIKSRKSKIRSCPYVGCSNSNIKNTDLVKDPSALISNQAKASTPQKSIELD